MNAYGVGKTTAVRILGTLLRPDSGEARVCGYDTQRDAHHQLIGLTGQARSRSRLCAGTTWPRWRRCWRPDGRGARRVFDRFRSLPIARWAPLAG